ncbi:MAG: hypothetical protein JRH16_15465 [Deltaproteobacteria bacterium]|nr:hypothetical protein [Deltaproteobacteria bacterium]
MKTKKLLRKMKALLSADQRAQVAKYDSLEKVLNKLEKKEVALCEKLDGEREEGRRRELLRKLDVIEAQRKKGERLKQEIEKLRDTE